MVSRPSSRYGWYLGSVLTFCIAFLDMDIVNVKSGNFATTQYKVYFGTRTSTTSLFVATVDLNTSKTTWVSTDYKKLTFYSTEGKSSAALDLSDTNNWLGFFGLNKVTETVI